MTPLEIMDDACGDDIKIVFSGAECGLISTRLDKQAIQSVSLDTGRLNPETYELFDKVEKHFNIKIEYCIPNEEKREALVNEGLFSFYQDGHKECCGIRKVQPLRKKLSTLKAWITGQRKDQSPGTRMQVPAIQLDPAFQGILNGNELVKYNPLTNATSQEVWDFLRVMSTPVNALHSQGYVSIGCAPCTRPVTPGQQEREGRWWWENASDKECGLHSGNLSKEEKISKISAKKTRPISSRTLRLFRWKLESRCKKNFSRRGVKNEENEMIVLYLFGVDFVKQWRAALPSPLKRTVKLRTCDTQNSAPIKTKEWSKENLSLSSFPTILFFEKGREGFVKLSGEERDGILCRFSSSPSSASKSEYNKENMNKHSSPREYRIGKNCAVWHHRNNIISFSTYTFCYTSGRDEKNKCPILFYKISSKILSLSLLPVTNKQTNKRVH